MSRTRYDESNQAKASFDEAYSAPTPHRYLADMAAIEYRLAERMQPFLSAVVDASRPAETPARVLDVGCSYGISGALLKTGCTFAALSAFYRDASRVYGACIQESRAWLQGHDVRQDVAIVGLDSSRAAVRFATDAHLIDRGITCNLELPGTSLTEADRAVIATCDVLFSCGTIGYVSDRTMHPLLNALGAGEHGALGPVAVMSVLELFDPEPIAETFSTHGFCFGALPFCVAQRRFADQDERERVLAVSQRRGWSTDAHETKNQMFATLCVAAVPEHFDTLVACVTDTATALLPMAQVLRAGPAPHRQPSDAHATTLEHA